MCDPECTLCATPCTFRVRAVYHPMCVPCATPCMHAVCHPGPRSAPCTEHLAHTCIHTSDTRGHRQAGTSSGSPHDPRAQDLRSLGPREWVFSLPSARTLPGADGARSPCAQRMSTWLLGAAKPARRNSRVVRQPGSRAEVKGVQNVLSCSEGQKVRLRMGEGLTAPPVLGGVGV